MDAVLKNDLLVTFLVLIYVLSLISVCEALVSKRFLSTPISRKIVHIGAASWLIFWPLYSENEDSSSWSWKLNALVPSIKGFELFVKGAVLRDPNDKDVRSMSRSGNPVELLLGPLQFTLVMTYCGIFLYREPVSALIMGAVGIGDGIAPLVGQYFGKHRYRSPFSGSSSDTKSIEGSGGVFFGTIIGYYTYSFILSTSGLLSFPSLVICAFVAAIVEALAPSNIDNICIPAAMYLVHNFFVPR